MMGLFVYTYIYICVCVQRLLEGLLEPKDLAF